jgi:hypothetical protein
LAIPSLKLPSRTFSHTLHSLSLLLLLQSETCDLPASRVWLCYDPSMLIIIFITLYGIPLVVTRRYISFERFQPNQRIFKSRG